MLPPVREGEVGLSLVHPRDAALFSGATLLGVVLTFVTGVVAARWLGPAVYGEVSVVRSAYAILAIVAPLGLDVALLRHLGENAGNWPRSLAQLRGFRTICAVVNLGVLVAAALWIGPWLGAHVYRQPGFSALLTLALVGLPFAGDAAILSATLRALGAVSVQNLGMLVLQPIARTAALLVFLGAGFGAAGMVASTLIGVVAAAAALAIGLHTHAMRRALAPAAPDRADRGVMAGVFRYSRWLAALLLLNNGLRVVDILALGQFRSPAEVGQYAALSAIAGVIVVLPQAISQTLSPNVTRLHAVGDLAGVRAVLGRYLRWAVLLSSPVFAGVAVFGPWLDLVFGDRFRFDALLSLVLACVALATGCLSQMGVALTMTGRHRQEFVVLLCGSGIAAALCWGLAPRFGGLGVGVGVLIGTLALNGARMTLSARFLGGFAIRWRDALAPPLACLALAALENVVLTRLGPHAWPTAAAGAVVLVAGFAALYAAVLLTPDEKRALLGASWRR